jgi:hypothetical protein
VPHPSSRIAEKSSTLNSSLPAKHALLVLRS